MKNLLALYIFCMGLSAHATCFEPLPGSRDTRSFQDTCAYGQPKFYFVSEDEASEEFCVEDYGGPLIEIDGETYCMVD